MSMRRAALYLQIPADYCRSFGGLRWAQYGEAVEFLEGPAGGHTFAFAREIALFLEGIQAAGEFSPAFGFVLHLLYLMGLGDRAGGPSPGHRLERIAAAFHALECPLRNAGALGAWLCRDAPLPADPPELGEVHSLLSGGSWVPQMVLSHEMLGVIDQAEQPGLRPEEFEQLIRAGVDALSDEAIGHWLRYGRGPAGEAGERLARFRPRSLSAALADLEQRPRLAGVGRLISRLEGALSLPPRRLAWSEIQNGGYSDVTTRGAPEQILPIQFALDGEEFLRRFAERELLYYQKEEPRQPTTEELVLLLDQGVRTWGDVRLVLAGAALALARQAERRRIAIKLATTGNGGEPVDPSEIDSQALSALLEASDLSLNPGQALAALLQSPAASRRDVVLLTHPRCLSAADVAVAAGMLADNPGARLFAVSVDSAGQVALAELRGGMPVVLGRSRINIVDDPIVPESPPSRPHLAGRRLWKGSVESIPFPFHCGTLDRIDSPQNDGRRHFDFDESGDQVLVVGRYGLIFTWRIDGTEFEILPRPLIDHEVMRPVKTVLGVAGGFVLVSYRQGCPVLAHYDLRARHCIVHRIDQIGSKVHWVYYADLHSIAGRPAKGRPSVAIDLGVPGPKAMTTQRAATAAARNDAGLVPYRFWRDAQAAAGDDAGLLPYPLPAAQIEKSATEPWIDSRVHEPSLNSYLGQLSYRQGAGETRSLIPLADGQPALKGRHLLQTRQGGDILAVLAEGSSGAALYFVSISREMLVGIFSLGGRNGTGTFALSRQGTRFALLRGDRELEVRDVPGHGPPVFVSPKEDSRVHFATLGRSCLLVREFDAGETRFLRAQCLIRWDQGRLEVVHREVYSILSILGGVIAQSRSLPTGKISVHHDPMRFVQHVEHESLCFLIDRYNQIAAVNRSGELLALFYITREEVAAWLPDGTCLGPRRLIGGEPTPGAAERIAAVLRSAESSGGNSP
jgi:hypothetical protein